jgi:hypothetical protein
METNAITIIKHVDQIVIFFILDLLIGGDISLARDAHLVNANSPQQWIEYTKVGVECQEKYHHRKIVSLWSLYVADSIANGALLSNIRKTRLKQVTHAMELKGSLVYPMARYLANISPRLWKRKGSIWSSNRRILELEKLHLGTESPGKGSSSLSSG